MCKHPDCLRSATLAGRCMAHYLEWSTAEMERTIAEATPADWQAAYARAEAYDRTRGC